MSPQHRRPRLDEQAKRPRELLPVTRFRGPGRYTLTLRATDKSGLTSLPARRTFSHG